MLLSDFYVSRQLLQEGQSTADEEVTFKPFGALVVPYKKSEQDTRIAVRFLIPYRCVIYCANLIRACRYRLNPICFAHFFDW